MKAFILILTLLFVTISTTYSQTGTFTFDGASVNTVVDPNTVTETISSTPNVTITISSLNGNLADDIKKTTNNSFAGSSGFSVFTNFNQSTGVTVTFSRSGGGTVNVTTMHVYVISTGTFDLVFTPNTGSAVTKTGVVGGSSGGADVTLNFIGITSFAITTITGSPNFYVNPGLDNVVMDAALPVELSSFTAIVNGNAVNLKWQTATEVNNYGFEIQRSAVSDQPSAWVKIGFVAGAGNSNSPKSYSFTDQPTGGTSFSYRLKQIDNDGQFKIYEPITVLLSYLDKAELMQNSPNPFNPSTTIKFYIPNNSDVSIKIFDMLGKEVTTLINNQSEAGYHIVYWNGRDSFGSQAASGVYLYRLTAVASTSTSTSSVQSSATVFTETKKMLLMK